MMNGFARTALVAAACVLGACSKDAPTSGFRATSADLAGSWRRVNTVPGSGESWNLVVSDTIVGGSGTWSGEACCSGPLAVVGYVSRDSVHLDITLTIEVGNPRPPLHEHFDGTLLTPTRLVGQATFAGGPTGTVEMERVR